MKLRFLLTAVICTVSVTGSAQEQAGLTTDLQKFSYAVGLQIGNNIRAQGMLAVDAKAIAMAIEDVLTGATPRLTVPEMQAAQGALREALLAEQQAKGADNMIAWAKFLDENRAREGIKELDSGVQYKVVTAGTGDKPKKTDTVQVHYSGTLLDGMEFDSSYARGTPAEFEVGQVIPGWQEALQAMPVGSKWEVWIPSVLAYGDKGAGASIGPNETLHFVIELLSIKAES